MRRRSAFVATMCVGFVVWSIACVEHREREGVAARRAPAGISWLPVTRTCHPSNSRGLEVESPLMITRVTSAASAFTFICSCLARTPSPCVLRIAMSTSRSPPPILSASTSGLITPTDSVYASFTPRKATPGRAPSREYA
jgi:hypothetical protein